MHIIKKILRGLSAYGFRAALFGFTITLAISLTFQEPNPTKQLIRESGFYDIPINKLINSEQVNGGEENENGEESVSFNNPIVQNALNEAIPKEKRQDIVETVIDGTYVWLNGNAENPDFYIDLNPEKEAIIQGIADGAYDRIASLPQCTPAQLANLNGRFDPFNIECQPPVDLSQEKQRLIDEYRTSDEFLGDPTLDGASLFGEAKRHDSTNNAHNIPKLFTIAMSLPLILGLAAAVAAVGVVLLSETRRKGIRKVGKLFIETAISLAIVGAGLYFILGGATAGLQSQVTPEVNEAANNVFNGLRMQLITPVVVFLICYLILGIILLVYTRKKSTEDIQHRDGVSDSTGEPLKDKNTDNSFSGTTPDTQQADNDASSSLPEGMAEKIAAARKNNQQD